MKAPSSRTKMVLAILTGTVAVVLVAVLVSVVAPRLPRVITADEVSGTWTSDKLAGTITFGDDGQLTITDLGIDLTDEFGNDSNFDGSGTWKLSHEPNTVSIVLTTATVNDELQEMTRYSSTLQFSMLSGTPVLFVVDFNDEQPYYFTREAS